METGSEVLRSAPGRGLVGPGGDGGELARDRRRELIRRGASDQLLCREDERGGAQSVRQAGERFTGKPDFPGSAPPGRRFQDGAGPRFDRPPETARQPGEIEEVLVDRANLLAEPRKIQVPDPIPQERAVQVGGVLPEWLIERPEDVQDLRSREGKERADDAGTGPRLTAEERPLERHAAK